MSKEEIKQEATQGGLVMTPDTFRALIVETIAAAKAPNAVEQAALDKQKLETKQAQEARVRQSAEVIAELEAKKWTKLNCSHEHPDGKSHGVYVQERNSPGYILCQSCQAVIRPEPQPKDYKGSAIYNTAMFNKVFQKLQSLTGDIIV